MSKIICEKYGIRSDKIKEQTIHFLVTGNLEATKHIIDNLKLNTRLSYYEYADLSLRSTNRNLFLYLFERYKDTPIQMKNSFPNGVMIHSKYVKSKNILFYINLMIEIGFDKEFTKLYSESIYNLMRRLCDKGHTSPDRLEILKELILIDIIKIESVLKHFGKLDYIKGLLRDIALDKLLREDY